MSIETASTYLGDGAYAEFSGWDVCIYTSNGVARTGSVYLGDHELDNLLNFLRDVVKVKRLQGDEK